MTPEQLQYIRQECRDLTDHELLRRVALEESEFLPEAMQILREELELRNIKALNAQEYFAQFPNEDPAFGFCQRCLDLTTSEGPGFTDSRGIFGPRLLGYNHECEACGSLLVAEWFCILFPVRKTAEYRVLYKKPPSLYTEVYRKVKERNA